MSRGERKLVLTVPADTYDVMTVTLDTGRKVTVVVPADLDTREAKKTADELRALADVLYGLQGN